MIRLTLPYATLCPDNQRHGVVMIKRNPRIILTAKYRKAKEKIGLLAMGQYKGEPLECELEMEATLYPPTARKTDPANFSKCIHDALQGIVYADDYQLRTSKYIRGAIDRINPRIEITISEAA